MSLKIKTVNGLYWSFIDSFANQGVQFIVGLILARLLSPHEFGLIGMLTIFIAISQSFIDSGFSNALIRKKECSQSDYSTVFYFNLLISMLCYLLLFVFAGTISSFFQEPQLKLLVQVLGVSLILNSIAIVQRTILTKTINFKLQTRVSLIASTLSGIIAIIMAYRGCSVWSLVALTLGRFGLNSLFLWMWSSWKPTLEFNRASFNELFSFGSKLLLSGLIDTIYRNIYYLIIGRYFSAVELGYYTRADQFQALPSQNLNGIINRVSYPVLAKIQDDKDQLKRGYKKIIKSTMFVTFTIMLCMAAVSQSLIIVLIGEKWLPAVGYLQLLCFVGMLYPLHALNLDMLQVLGRSDLFLRLEIIKKILAVPVIILGIFFNIKLMILGMLFNSIVAYYLNSYWSGKFINYPIFEQVKDIYPSFLLATTVSVIIFLLGFIMNFAIPVRLALQSLFCIVLVVGLAELLKLDSYLYIKEIIFEKLFKRGYSTV